MSRARSLLRYASFSLYAAFSESPSFSMGNEVCGQPVSIFTSTAENFIPFNSNEAVVRNSFFEFRGIYRKSFVIENIFLNLNAVVVNGGDYVFL